MTTSALTVENYTRDMYVEDILFSLSDDELVCAFGASREEIENGCWNANLEIGYNQVVN